jgi:hypothetical protein
VVFDGGRAQFLEGAPRRGVAGGLLEDVAAFDVDVRGAGVVALRRIRGSARVAARERAPDDAESRERVRGEVGEWPAFGAPLALKPDHRFP